MNIYQRNEEWFEARLGHLTASSAAAAFEVLRDGTPSTKSENELLRIVAERLTGTPTNQFVSASMQWGTENEDSARDRYEMETGEIVDLVGFIKHPTIEWLGASPDGLVGTDGLLEIKCPTTQVHVTRAIEGVVPEEYKPQMLVQLLCTGRKWVDFVDFDPRILSSRGQFFCVRFIPTEEELKETEEKCRKFLERVAERFSKFKAMTGITA